LARKQPHTKGSPAIVRKWSRILACGCSHGDLANKERLAEVLAFKQTYKPKYVVELGDLMDTAAFRSGARGTADESVPVAPDTLAACDWIRALEPTHVAYGNHDWRLRHWMEHPNAILSHAATVVWNALDDTVKSVGAITVPYDIDDGWFKLGAHYWGHGYMFNEHAVRDHAEMLGGPVVMAHVHVPQQVPGRVRGAQGSFCVGTLADVKKLSYARTRRNTTRWNGGCVWGEVCENESRLWLSEGVGLGPIQFPTL